MHSIAKQHIAEENTPRKQKTKTAYFSRFAHLSLFNFSLSQFSLFLAVHCGVSLTLFFTL